jgi:hypothetical protein
VASSQRRLERRACSGRRRRHGLATRRSRTMRARDGARRTGAAAGGGGDGAGTPVRDERSGSATSKGWHRGQSPRRVRIDRDGEEPAATRAAGSCVSSWGKKESRTAGGLAAAFGWSHGAWHQEHWWRCNGEDRSGDLGSGGGGCAVLVTRSRCAAGSTRPVAAPTPVSGPGGRCE